MSTPRSVLPDASSSIFTSRACLLTVSLQVPVVSTAVSEKAINKFTWDGKDGRRAALGGSDGKLYIYDIGDMAIPRESEWTDLQRTLASMQGGSAQGAVPATDTVVAGR